MTRVLALLVSCGAAALVFLAVAGVSHVPFWLLALSLTFWAILVGSLVWQPLAAVKQPARRSGPPAP